MAKQPRKPKTQSEIFTGKPKLHNRAYEVRRDNDNVKDYKVKLEDIDTAILYYLDNIVLPNVSDNGNSLRIPVMYGSPEKWHSAGHDGFFKDKDGKIQVPLVMFRRTNVTKNRDLSNKIDANFPQLYQSFTKRWSRKNAYVPFSILNNVSPSREQFNVIVPDYVTISYEFIIWTDFVDQMNDIIEAVNYSEGTYWGEPERFKFRVRVDDYTNITDLPADNDRIIRTSFNLNLSGYIITDTLNKAIAQQNKKVYTNFILRFGQEVDNINELVDAKPVAVAKTAVTTQQSSNSSTILNSTVASYLALNITKDSDAISGTNTAIFYDSYIATAPAPLPATSKDNFVVFINGQLIPVALIISISQVGTTVEITFDTVNLGYSLSYTDHVIAIGKFNPSSDTTL